MPVLACFACAMIEIQVTVIMFLLCSAAAFWDFFALTTLKCRTNRLVFF